MIKFKGVNPSTNKAFFGFGLSEENILCLKKGMPIKINGLDIESVYDYLIFYGETEEDMYNDLSSFIGKNTEVIKKEERDQK